MAEDISRDLEKIAQNFQKLIIERCKFCQFDQYLTGHPKFEFPTITKNMLNSNQQCFISIPGLVGGFAYYLTTIDNRPVLYAEQSSRMGYYSRDDYDYFEITADSSVLIDGGLREKVKNKFWELLKQSRQARSSKVTTKSSEQNQATLTNRARGMLVGLAIGDALGANLEFTTFHHSEITDDKIAMYDGMWPKGAWTDDTSMALCLGNSLLECGGYDSYDVMQKYQKWVEQGYCSFDDKPASDIGMQTQAAIERFKNEPIIDQYDQRSESAGNGTIMRLAPVILATMNLPIQSTIKLAQVSARETHYSWEAEAGTEIFAAMLRQAMEGKNKEEVIHVEKFSTGETYDDILQRVLKGSEKNCQANLEDLSGYVVDALTIAVWGLKNFNDFETSMRAVIKLGGDNDTNGAIYGQLAGAYYGYEAIPKNWKQDLLRESEIKERADKLLVMPSCPIIKTRFEEDNL